MRMNGFSQTLLLFGSVFVLLMGCSRHKSRGGGADSGPQAARPLIYRPVPKWYQTLPAFQLQAKDGEVAPHFFFDITPAYNPKDKMIRAVVVTPAGSDTLNRLDMVSGQHVTSARFCKQRAVRSPLGFSFERPVFSYAVVPRLFSNNDAPVGVLVFGGAKEYRESFHSSYTDVRLVGALTFKECPSEACTRIKHWRRSLVLVGVDPQDPTFGAMRSLPQIKEVVKWEQVEAFYEQMEGVIRVDKKLRPKRIVTGSVGVDRAMQFIKDYAIFFSAKKLNGMKLGCRKLYNELFPRWKRALHSVQGLTDVKTVKDEVGYSQQMKVFKEQVTGDAERYHAKLRTCMRYVYPSSLRGRGSDHWELTLMAMLLRAHDLGHRFDCNRGSWDPYLSSKEDASQWRIWKECSGRDFVKALDLLPNYFENLRDAGMESVTYLDYDSRTHQRIQGLVSFHPINWACEDKTPTPAKGLSAFPPEILRITKTLFSKRAMGLTF